MPPAPFPSAATNPYSPAQPPFTFLPRPLLLSRRLHLFPPPSTTRAYGRLLAGVQRVGASEPSPGRGVPPVAAAACTARTGPEVAAVVSPARRNRSGVGRHRRLGSSCGAPSVRSERLPTRASLLFVDSEDTEKCLTENEGDFPGYREQGKVAANGARL